MHVCMLANVEGVEMKTEGPNQQDEGIDQCLGQSQATILREAGSKGRQVFQELRYGMIRRQRTQRGIFQLGDGELCNRQRNWRVVGLREGALQTRPYANQIPPVIFKFVAFAK